MHMWTGVLAGMGLQYALQFCGHVGGDPFLADVEDDRRGRAPSWAAATSRTSICSALKDTVVLPSLVSDLRIFPVMETTASGTRTGP